MPDIEPSPAETGVPLSEWDRDRYNNPVEAANARYQSLDLGFYDKEVEEVVAHLFYTVLNDPRLMNHVLDLAKLRDPGQTDRVGELSVDVDRVEVTGTHSLAWLAYFAALQESPLLEVFDLAELDYLVSNARQRIQLGYWGKLGPVNAQGHGYGRQKDRRGKGMKPETIEKALEAIVRRLPELDPGQTAEAEEAALYVSCLKCDAQVGDECAGGAMHAARLEHAAWLKAHEDDDSDGSDGTGGPQGPSATSATDKEEGKKAGNKRRKILQRVRELVKS
jgi:hypothetical protein